MKGRISEVFESVQGEGIYLGEKQLFVRFFGCNLNCNYCDTKLEDFKEYEPHELMDEIKAYHDDYHSISFTGGEPLLQKDFLKEILYYTKCYGFKNYLETNGSLPGDLSEVIENVDIIAMDLKLPSSSGFDRILWDEHKNFLKIASQKEVFLKSVVCDSTSEVDLIDSLNLIKEADRSAVLVLQPNFVESNTLLDKLNRFKEICLDHKVTACVIPQMHKVAGVK